MTNESKEAIFYFTEKEVRIILNWFSCTESEFGDSEEDKELEKKIWGQLDKNFLNENKV